MMKHALYTALFVVAAAWTATPADAAGYGSFPHQGTPPPNLCRPANPAAPPQARVVHVTVPPAQQPPPWCAPCPPSRPAKPGPVRVEVSVRPELPCETHPVPLMYHERGPLQAALYHGTGLVGAAVAFPLRLVETVCPLPQPERPPVHCHPAAVPCPPPFVTGPPAGPCAAPFPRAGAPAPCGPHFPARVVRDAEYPPIEPQTLLGGIVTLPSRMLQTGRFFGDLGATGERCRSCASNRGAP